MTKAVKDDVSPKKALRSIRPCIPETALLTFWVMGQYWATTLAAIDAAKPGAAGTGCQNMEGLPDGPPRRCDFHSRVPRCRPGLRARTAQSITATSTP
jgi:hypothetical protein